MLRKIVLSIGGATCLFAGTLAFDANGIAHAASNCLSGPNRESGPGTHWHYRIDHATKQRCWYLKKVGGPSRPRPSGEARAKSSGEARVRPSEGARSRATTETRARPSVEARTTSSEQSTENESSIKAWFSATFSALSGSTASGTKMVKAEPITNEPTLRRRRSNEADRPEQSKSERSEQSKSQRSEQTKMARAQQQSAAAEAAGDKDVAPPPPSDSEPEWQKALYEEFLQWRVKQLLFE